MKVRRIAPKQQFRQKRVAAYARVSTLKEEQEESEDEEESDPYAGKPAKEL